MAERLYPKKRKRKRDLSHRRWRVNYQLMVVEGGGLVSWTGYHHTRRGALFAAWWNQHVATYGGTVFLIDQKENND